MCLLQVRTTIGFVPALLQLVMSEQLGMRVRKIGLLLHCMLAAAQCIVFGPVWCGFVAVFVGLLPL